MADLTNGAAQTFYSVSSGPSLSLTVPAGTDLVLVFVHALDGGNTPSGMTLAGNALTHIDDGTGVQTQRRCEVWGYASSSMPAGSQTLDVTWSGSPTRCLYSVVYCTGVDMTTPWSGGNQAAGTGTGPSLSIASAAGDMAIAGVASYNDGGAPTWGGTTGHDLVATEDAHLVDAGVAWEDGAASVSMPWTLVSSANWGMAGVSVHAAASGPSAATLAEGTGSDDENAVIDVTGADTTADHHALIRRSASGGADVFVQTGISAASASFTLVDNAANSTSAPTPGAANYYVLRTYDASSNTADSSELAITLAPPHPDGLHFGTNVHPAPAMDTDSNADGAADGFVPFADGTTHPGSTGLASAVLSVSGGWQSIELASATGGGAAGIQTSTYAAAEGEEWNVEARCYVSGVAGSAKPRLMLIFRDSSGSATKIEIGTTLTLTSDARVSLTATAPASTTTVEAWLEIASQDAGDAGTLYAKEFELWKTASPVIADGFNVLYIDRDPGDTVQIVLSSDEATWVTGPSFVGEWGGFVSPEAMPPSSGSVYAAAQAIGSSDQRSSYSETLAVTTGGPVTGLAISGTGKAGPTLSWTPPSPAPDSIHVYQSLTDGFVYNDSTATDLSGALAGSATGYGPDANITRGVPNYFLVTTVYGSSVYVAAQVSITMDAGPDAATLTEGTVTSSSVGLTIGGAANADTVDLYRDGVLYAAGVSLGAYTDSDVTAGASYTYRPDSNWTGTNPATTTGTNLVVTTPSLAPTAVTSKDYLGGDAFDSGLPADATHSRSGRLWIRRGGEGSLFALREGDQDALSVMGSDRRPRLLLPPPGQYANDDAGYFGADSAWVRSGHHSVELVPSVFPTEPDGTTHTAGLYTNDGTVAAIYQGCGTFTGDWETAILVCERVDSDAVTVHVRDTTVGTDLYTLAYTWSDGSLTLASGCYGHAIEEPEPGPSSGDLVTLLLHYRGTAGNGRQIKFWTDTATAGRSLVVHLFGAADGLFPHIIPAAGSPPAQNGADFSRPLRPLSAFSAGFVLYWSGIDLGAGWGADSPTTGRGLLRLGGDTSEAGSSVVQMIGSGTVGGSSKYTLEHSDNAGTWQSAEVDAGEDLYDEQTELLGVVDPVTATQRLIVAKAGTVVAASPAVGATAPTLATAGTDVLRDRNRVLDPTSGVYVRSTLLEAAATNLLLSSGSPATQTVTGLTNQAYTLWMDGTGSVAASGATDGAYGSATDGSPLTFTPTATQDVTFTVTGSPTRFQLETGSFPTSYIATTGAAASRSADALSETSVPTPQNMTFYVRLVERHPSGTGALRVFGIGSADGGAAPWLAIYRTGSGYYSAFWNNGTDGNTFSGNTVSAGAATYGDLVELRLILASDGSLDLSASINGGAENGTGPGTAPASGLVGAWAKDEIHIGYDRYPTNPQYVGSAAFLALLIGSGSSALSALAALADARADTSTSGVLYAYYPGDSRAGMTFTRGSAATYAKSPLDLGALASDWHADTVDVGKEGASNHMAAGIDRWAAWTLSSLTAAYDGTADQDLLDEIRARDRTPSGLVIA